MERKGAPRPEFDAETDAFFGKSSLAPFELITNHEWRANQDWDEDEDDDYAASLAKAKAARKAMHATFGIAGVAAVLVGGFLVYSRVIMPVPVELGAAGVVVPTLGASTETAAAAETFAAAPAAAEPIAAAPADLVMAPVVVAPVAQATQVQAQAPAARHPVASPAHRTAAVGGSRDPKIAGAYRALNSGKFSQAVAAARSIVDASPERAEAWLVLGSAYAALHDAGSAKLAFRACAVRARGAFVRECQKLARD